MLSTHGGRQALSDRCPGSRQTPDQSCQPRDSESSPAYSESVPLSADAASGAPSDSSSQFSSAISLLGQRFQPLRRIAKGSREAAGAKLKAILEDVVASNTVEAWERLLLFPRRCLHKPSRGGQRWSLASQVNRQIADEEYLPVGIDHNKVNRSTSLNNPAKYLSILLERFG